MKKLVKLVLILIVAYPLISIAVSSCAGESDCSMAGRPMLFCTINKVENDKAVADTLDSLTVTAFFTDSTIINNIKNVSSVSLPLRYTNDTTTLVFHYSRISTDTIIIEHSNKPTFISMDCGYEVKQDILKLTYSKHRLDSVRVTNTSTNTNETKNLELFFR